MAKKKGRDCTECIAYCNMLGGEGYRCVPEASQEGISGYAGRTGG